MKLQIKLEQLARLDITQAVRLLATNAKKIETSPTPIPILIFAEHQYPDPKYKGKTLPLILIGEYGTDWKGEFNDRKKKDASAGQCIVRDGVVKIELTDGKSIKSDVLKEITLIFKQGRLGVEIHESIAEEGGSSEPKATVNTQEEQPKADKNGAADQPEKVAKVKEVVSKQGKKLAELLDTFRERFQSISKKTIPNLKSDKANRSDYVNLRETNEVIADFEKIYSKTHKTLQKAFADAKAKMDKQRDLLKKLGSQVKAKKQTLAKQLADAFYQKKKGRPADASEEMMMQESLKAAMQAQKIADLQGEERQQRLKAIYATAQFRGAYFTPDDVEKVYEKIAE